jgi:hypothetical protein
MQGTLPNLKIQCKKNFQHCGAYSDKTGPSYSSPPPQPKWYSVFENVSL